MKIAFFHELQRFSGAGKVVNQYGRILKKNNTVDLYYIDNKKDDSAKVFFTNVYYYEFKEKKWEGNNSKSRLYKDTFELFKLYSLHKKIAKVINSKEYDFVFVNPSKYTQAPFILRFVNNGIYFCQEPLRIIYDELLNVSKIKGLRGIYQTISLKLRKSVDKSNISYASIVLANSKFSRANIKKAYNIDSTVCYLGVDEKLYAPSEADKVYDVYFTGEKEWIEGYDLFKKMHETYDGKLKVLFSGRKEGTGVSEKEMAKNYQKSKIAVSLSKNEPFGLAPLEAMACGVPVIAVKEGGLKEAVVDQKTGYLINRDAQELKTKISDLLSDKSLRNIMGKSARKHVLKEFTWEKSVERFLSIVMDKL